MLPSTPLHHLLLDAFDASGAPGAPGGVLVMTSGNRSDEPIAYVDDDARQRLDPIADVFVTHNRPIHIRCDDSVTRSFPAPDHLIRPSPASPPNPSLVPHS